MSINVLSLFDGMSCGRIALDKAGIEVGTYYASEIDKYAQIVSEANYPEIVRLGDVTLWQLWDVDWSSIDLILAGSPCQGFSFAGKQLAFDDPRSALFFVFIDILNHIKTVNPRVKFLLENVRMKKEHLDVISDQLGVEPVNINSNLLSAQNRNRYYWANWQFGQPEDKGTVLADVLEAQVESKFDISERQLQRLDLSGVAEGGFRACFQKPGENVDKSECMNARDYKGISGRQHFTLAAYKPASIIGRRLNDDGVRKDYDKTVPITQCLEVRKTSKIPCLTTVQKDSVVSRMDTGRYPGAYDSLTEGVHYRKLTPVECERLQTVPDNYTNHVSNTQRYKMLGNGWTVDVIVHILTGGNFKCVTG